MNDNEPLESRSHLWVKDIKAEDQVEGLYMVSVKRAGLTKRGDSFLSLTLTDRTGRVEARVWDRVEALSPLFKEGDVVEIKGAASSYRNQVQIVLSDLKIAGDVADPSIFLETTPGDVDEMVRALRALLREIGNRHVRALTERFFSDRAFMSLYKKAPAAKNFHHSYLGGLLEHTLSVCRMAKIVSEHYVALDKDLMLAGAFLHDIGKVKEFKFDRHIDYTDEGRLLGHLILGVGMLDERLAGLKDFPQDLALRLKHLILSHHGEYEFGSPKRPKFLEAFALHLIDDLDAKMIGLGRFLEQDQQEGSWTDFNRLFERYFLKGQILGKEDAGVPSTGEQKQRGLFSE
ncbi:MAG: HD domain-containing protein [Pseudomonadota bacterium]